MVVLFLAVYLNNSVHKASISFDGCGRLAFVVYLIFEHLLESFIFKLLHNFIFDLSAGFIGLHDVV